MGDTGNNSESKPAKRGGFQKGKSGNPSGRPKVVEEFRERARKAVDEHVLQRWVDEVVNGGEYWMRASEMLAAYGYGKPPSAPEDNDALRDSGARVPLTREEALAIARGETP